MTQPSTRHSNPETAADVPAITFDRRSRERQQCPNGLQSGGFQRINFTVVYPFWASPDAYQTCQAVVDCTGGSNEISMHGFYDEKKLNALSESLSIFNHNSEASG
jgi:hypothetical protein